MAPTLGAHNFSCLRWVDYFASRRWVDYFVMRPSGGPNWDSKFERHWAGGTGRSSVGGWPYGVPNWWTHKKGAGGSGAFGLLLS